VDEQKAVELLKSFLQDLIKHFGSAAYKRESEGFNHRVCLKVFEEMYPE